MRVVVLGAGAIGSFFGGQLAKAGADVTFVVRKARAELLTARGLLIESPLGDFAVRPRIETLGSEPKPADVLILTCKAHDLTSALDTIAPLTGPGTIVAPFLNGLRHLDNIERRLPMSTIVGALSHLSVTVTAAGVVAHSSPHAAVKIGARATARLTPAQTTHLDAIIALWASGGISAARSLNIEREMWAKFVFLGTLAAATGSMRAPIGMIAGQAEGEALITRLWAESKAVALASGIDLSTADLASYETLLRDRQSPIKASMLHDIERGTRTEAEHIVGDLVDRGADFGVATPSLRHALLHLRLYEAQREAPSKPGRQ
jgi:2-dehydropantoate 2-reductase